MHAKHADGRVLLAVSGSAAGRLAFGVGALTGAGADPAIRVNLRFPLAVSGRHRCRPMRLLVQGNWDRQRCAALRISTAFGRSSIEFQSARLRAET